VCTAALWHASITRGRANPASSDVFAEWNWDGNTLAVRNDPWGFQPLFYSANAERIAVATSIPRLLELGVPADLDEAALAVFLRLSHFLAMRFAVQSDSSAAARWPSHLD